jgi:6,7-dimethyl-8-ribityllumazine synthase
MTATPNIVVIEARFYEDISDQLAAGAIAAIEAAGGSIYRITVPGILEIPAALQFAIEGQGNPDNGQMFDGAVVLGCAIKGETDHYEHVCGESMRGTQDVALAHAFPVGNGILTCPTRALAEERADPARRNFGGGAAEACIRLIEIRLALGVEG